MKPSVLQTGRGRNRHGRIWRAWGQPLPEWVGHTQARQRPWPSYRLCQGRCPFGCQSAATVPPFGCHPSVAAGLWRGGSMTGFLATGIAQAQAVGCGRRTTIGEEFVTIRTDVPTNSCTSRDWWEIQQVAAPGRRQPLHPARQRPVQRLVHVGRASICCLASCSFRPGRITAAFRLLTPLPGGTRVRHPGGHPAQLRRRGACGYDAA